MGIDLPQNFKYDIFGHQFIKEIIQIFSILNFISYIYIQSFLSYED